MTPHTIVSQLCERGLDTHEPLLFTAANEIELLQEICGGLYHHIRCDDHTCMSDYDALGMWEKYIHQTAERDNP